MRTLDAVRSRDCYDRPGNALVANCSVYAHRNDKEEVRLAVTKAELPSPGRALFPERAKSFSLCRNRTHGRQYGSSQGEVAGQRGE